ncbi:hypothetical protein IEQ34_010093 [Dendrobium chrysotoxum]|uniref:DCD domain-containing protein n=1 Tax=Dendrobium chrysotoxum TaxID=161865 RepID=A0AAV7H4S9_DENCH|nr:hypothetical protein IEQ34_010093 [Dendrobium chrysotoxum]
MGKPKEKEVGNPSTTSEEPLSEKKNRKKLKAAKKIAKKSSKGNSKISDKLNTKDIKTVKEIAIKLDGSTQVNEKGEASTKGKEASTKETIGGLIFMCNGKTKPDCFRHKVFGLPENRKDFVFRIKPGTRLFLYDFDLKLLYGIFKASSFGGIKLEPAAFNGFYPAQVRFEVERACAPLPLHIFKHAIKDNYTGIRNKFNIELSLEQVKELTKLFPSLPQQQPIFNEDAPVPQPVQPLAPVPTPVALLWPTMLPFDGPAPLQREVVQAPVGAMPLDPRSLHEHEYINFGLNPNPFLVSPATAHGNAPDVYTHPYMAVGPYETKINYQNDPSQLRLDKVDFSLRPLVPVQPAHVRLPYAAMPRIGNFEPGASRDARLSEMQPILASNTLSGYVNRDPRSVSSRYLFAGPSIYYRQGPA